MTEVKAKFCQYCGRELPKDATFCPSCGKPLGPQPPPTATVIPRATPPRPVRPSEVIVVSILLFLDGLAWMGAGLIYGALLGFLSVGLGGGLFLIGMIVGLFIWVVVIGLMLMQGWAYTLTLILAGISLFLFPIGTFFGIISIWLLLKSEVKEAFGKR